MERTPMDDLANDVRFADSTRSVAPSNPHPHMTPENEDTEYRKVTGFTNSHLVDQSLQSKASHSGLVSVNADITSGVGSQPSVRMSRASSSGSHRRLTPDEARQMARELREHEDTMLVGFLSGGRDDPEEIADSLEAAAQAVSTAENLDEDFLENLRVTIFKEVNDHA